MKTVLSSRLRSGALFYSGAVMILTASAALGAFSLVAPHAEAVSTTPASDNASSSAPAPLPSSSPASPSSARPPVAPTREAVPATLDKKITVTKVHEVRNDESNHAHNNDALQFEKEYWNYGAITKEQLEARRGQIYVISWKNGSAPDRFIAKFEYRQEKTREQIKVQTQEYPAVSGNARAIFKVVGAEYRGDGPVESWRFSVWRNGTIVAEEKSFIW